MEKVPETIQSVSIPASSRSTDEVTASGGANLSRVRAHNERLVLSLIRHEPLPRAEIARRSGLSAQTITLITRDLSNEGLIHAGPPIRGKVGQPSVPLTLKPDGAFFIGMKLGRRSAELIVINFLGQIVLRRQQHYLFPTPGQVVDFMRCEIPSLTRQLGQQSAKRLRGIGISMPFELWNWGERLSVPGELMEGWRYFRFDQSLKDITDLPVMVENDATAACGAELTFGQRRQPNNFAYFFIGYFVGGGLVLNGSVYRGISGNAGAFGSIPVFNTYADSGIAQLIDTASIHLFESKVLVKQPNDTGYIAHDSPAWADNSAELNTWINNLTQSLAIAIVAVNSVVDVSNIIIDGGFPSFIRDRIVSATHEAMELVDTKGIRVPEIIAGHVGPDARALGAARLPLFSCFLLDETVLTRGAL